MALRDQHSSQVMTTLLTPSPDKVGELLQTLDSLRPEIAGQPGCQACIVCRDVDGGSHLVLVTAWESREALQAHLASDPYRVLMGAAQLLGSDTEFRFVPSGSIPKWAEPAAPSPSHRTEVPPCAPPTEPSPR